MTAFYDQEKNTVVIVKPFAANRPYNDQNIQIPYLKSKEIHSTMQKVCQRLTP